MSNVVIIATTNYIDKLESRYKNRPSRFDRVIEFPLPNNESRKMFIEKTILPEDLDKINIEEWVKKTEGFTIDHINELILLYFVYGHSEKESFEIITDMVNNNNKLTNTSSINKAKLGF
jgi:SpoVK/Ycf46/Vps4 family AAA+-type ATPase